ncbi:membrane-associated guanylate kinase, WW and PDZ domain-containing protein 3 [Engraulis encrasicolus]|uniref:membrane-associated guanylate kinase, WW and PDZ domain-containing protein 3 n=1 Tax=Engraulis encrasicolus TaxID=184585 RepID=UPI002FD2CCB0
MSKAAVKKLHWRSKVHESFVPLDGASGDLGVAVGGGADYGEFPFVTAAHGGGFTVGDVILEIGGTPVLGMTLGDVRGVLNSCPHPVRIKTVSPGSTLCKDLRLYLSKCFTPGSMDSQLQQVIRENLYLRAVPCTTRQVRDGELPGVDYNFVSVEEFFSLEESGALLESGKFKVYPCSGVCLVSSVCSGQGGSAGASSLPAPTLSPSRSRDSSGGDANGLGHHLENGFGRHRRSSRRRTVSRSNWEMVYGDSGDSYYVDHSSKTSSWPEPRPVSRENSFSKTGLPIFTEQPGELRGYSVHARLSKGPRGFGFNIVGGSRPHEFLQVYSVTPGGPPTLNTADILVYINDTCVLGWSHRQAVEMLKCVPIGGSVDVVVRRGYPMLYDPDGCPKQPLPSLPGDALPGAPYHHHHRPTTTQPQPQSLPLPHLHLNGVLPNHLPPHPERTYTSIHSICTYTSIHSRRMARMSVDTNGNSSPMSGSPQRGATMSSYPSYSSMGPVVSRPHSSRGYHSNHHSPHSPHHLHYGNDNLASQSDSEVVSAIGSHRASLIRNHNNNSLGTPTPLRLHSAKSSESDLSTYAPVLPISHLPLPQPEMGGLPLPARPRSSSNSLTSSSPPVRVRRPSSSSGGGSFHRPKPHPHPALLTLPTPARGLSTSSDPFSPGPGSGGLGGGSPHHHHHPHHHHYSLNGVGGASGSSCGGSPNSSTLSPGGLSSGGSGGGGGGGVVRARRRGRGRGRGGMGFSVTAGGQGGRLAIVKRVWDRRQCAGLQPGDAIVKINGADVQSLSFAQVQRVLQEHTKRGEVILLVYRGGSIYSSVSPAPVRRHRPPPSPHLTPRNTQAETTTNSSLPPRTSLTPPPPSLVRSSLVQSTSFLDSVPVTLTMEPRDWMSADEAGSSPRQHGGGSSRRREEREKLRGATPPNGPPPGPPPVLRGYEVELKRRAGEGFGFVIASQDVENGRATSLLPHRFVTVRRGSPAARSGQIRPGDRLEAVEGRSVVTLPHRELAQILRRAGNSLRLTIVPRSSAHAADNAEHETNHRSRKGHKSRPKVREEQQPQPQQQQQDARYYSVDLERGPTGFGFSLRGGSEYNMGLYVLGLMEGGPASRSHRIQVSDQLVEINGESTTGMSHGQAVERIRTAGHHIRLVLKKGNGYVPDYGTEPAPGRNRPAALSSSSLHSPEPHLAAVDRRSRSRSRRGGGGRRSRGGDAGAAAGAGERRGRSRERGQEVRSPSSPPGRRSRSEVGSLRSPRGRRSRSEVGSPRSPRGRRSRSEGGGGGRRSRARGGRDRGERGGGGGEEEKRSRRRKVTSPTSTDIRSQEEDDGEEEEEVRRGGQRSRSLSANQERRRRRTTRRRRSSSSPRRRNTTSRRRRSHSDEELTVRSHRGESEKGEEREGRTKEREKRTREREVRSPSMERIRWLESLNGEEEEEEEEQEEQYRGGGDGDDDDDDEGFMPIPNQRLPRPRHGWEQRGEIWDSEEDEEEEGEEEEGVLEEEAGWEGDADVEEQEERVRAWASEVQREREMLGLGMEEEEEEGEEPEIAGLKEEEDDGEEEEREESRCGGGGPKQLPRLSGVPVLPVGAKPQLYVPVLPPAVSPRQQLQPLTSPSQPLKTHPFSFLRSPGSQAGYAESEASISISVTSTTAASISGLSLANLPVPHDENGDGINRISSRALQPGPWLRPSSLTLREIAQQRLSRRRRDTGGGGGDGDGDGGGGRGGGGGGGDGDGRGRRGRGGGDDEDILERVPKFIQ